MTVFTPRQAARVLLVDADGRVLLFRGWDPARPERRYWFTPGGGLDPDETPAAGAARELAEETGLRLPPAEFGEPIRQEVTEFSFGGQWYRQEQQFFLVRVTAFAVDTAGFDAEERDTIDIHHWWSIDELERTTERFYPTDLPELLRRALESEQRC
ncbi:NUDIX hydrolase [Plantactinospora mayteni]|uniref:DNA mismatch repair protein MutT n=1 Tax=Plantactinospora mayteni TaxID=566021 RepID=A0ABQ4EQB2_9ACTN|nr:NUDIX domain-containing protein [Plantactinospora mayteni]GIG96862.1 DNA mismatch repair protein MutT [Plantactinospora mayteni]